MRPYHPPMSHRIALLLLLSLASLAASAQTSGATTETSHVSAQRPRIALVLSGGGARGGAHLGVLKVLEELRVPVDLVVGTSAGSIVGAAYATGLPVSTIEQEMRGLSTALLFRDVVRDHQPPERKADDATNYVGPEMGVGAGGLSLPKGAVAGVALEAVLRRLTARQQHVDFDRFAVPFRAVATDLATSEMVVLGRGSLAQAVRASMAIPAVISPVELDGRLLVDGGVTRNLPVDVARRMGADVVIAVNIGTPLLRREDITSLLSASEQMLRILTATNVAQSLKELGPQDVLITPDLSRVSSSDFDHLADAAHGLTVRGHHRQRADIVQDILRRDGFLADPAFGEGEILGDRGIEMVADHEHVEMLVDRVHREGPRRVGGRRQHIRQPGDLHDVGRMAAPCPLDMVHVDGAALAGSNRVLAIAELVDGVGVQVHGEIIAVGSDEALVDDRGRRAEILVDLDRHAACRDGLLDGFGIGGAAAEEGIVEWGEFRRLQEAAEGGGRARADTIRAS